jgi:hypothetical protein
VTKQEIKAEPDVRTANRVFIGLTGLGADVGMVINRETLHNIKLIVSLGGIRNMLGA